MQPFTNSPFSDGFLRHISRFFDKQREVSMQFKTCLRTRSLALTFLRELDALTLSRLRGIFQIE
jgi:hypothetical protein